MKRIQTVITVPINVREQVIIRLSHVHVGPFDVDVDLQPAVGGMSPIQFGVSHESWEDGE